MTFPARIWGALPVLLFALTAIAQGQSTPPTENFYTRSLHYTNRGIEFVYSQEHGGLERLTGMTASELGCLKSKCHVTTCDECHRHDAEGKSSYSREQALTESACPRCHGSFEGDPDVHFSRGMKCMDCHTAREIHGDGTAHNTYMEPGFFDTRCENCHGSIGASVSHTVHGGKVDCAACHTREFVSCYNCHIDTRLAQGKDASLQLTNTLFLVNHDGCVTTANFLSYVYGNRTMITFAPAFAHSITKTGRGCLDCHDSRIVRTLQQKRLRLTEWKGGRLKNVEGVIPVLDGIQWDLVYLTRTDSVWVPLKNPEPPLLNYSGYCSPITTEQFARLTQAQTSP